MGTTRRQTSAPAHTKSTPRIPRHWGPPTREIFSWSSGATEHNLALTAVAEAEYSYKSDLSNHVSGLSFSSMYRMLLDSYNEMLAKEATAEDRDFVTLIFAARLYAAGRYSVNNDPEAI